MTSSDNPVGRDTQALVNETKAAVTEVIEAQLRNSPDAMKEILYGAMSAVFDELVGVFALERQGMPTRRINAPVIHQSNDAVISAVTFWKQAADQLAKLHNIDPSTYSVTSPEKSK